MHSRRRCLAGPAPAHPGPIGPPGHAPHRATCDQPGGALVTVGATVTGGSVELLAPDPSVVVDVVSRVLGGRVAVVDEAGPGEEVVEAGGRRVVVDAGAGTEVGGGVVDVRTVCSLPGATTPGAGTAAGRTST